ncbi:hypothetical protein SAMN04487972_10289 [Paracoccus halophilus]|uniref:Uncharacterized protein n=1 Tax=Paracoccus halophilus TaxID=376733 RepID=A0A1I0SNP8_9RHOB|nr:hypothetical protein [Paracoccus halophilus]SFA41145.1 hypothetical protein SAMN04487972_10289 [Paracoccus halophilus]
MTPRRQRLLAIAAALLVAGIFILANAHFFTVAFRSQPACVLSDSAMAARPAC